MKVEKIVLRRMNLKLKEPFQTSVATTTVKDFYVTEVHTKDHIGYGECVADEDPTYSEETVNTCEVITRDYLIPMLFEKKEFSHPDEVGELFSPIRRNMMAKSALEGAYWDLYAKQLGIPLARAIGGTKDEIEVGISLGIQENVDDMLRQVEKYLEQGYRRMKIKIKPGKDIKVLRAVRERFGNIPMMADANSAYSLNDIELFKRMDELDLMMIEQPLAHDDIFDHAKLQAEVKTPICLDESIHSYEDARKAIEMKSMRIINIKIGRVGGISEAKRIHDLCQANNIPVWCGGMLESGIGRAHNVAITTLPNFTLPGDTAGSSRYWVEDIINPEVVVSANGKITVPTGPGIGYEPVEALLEKYTIEKREFVRG